MQEPPKRRRTSHGLCALSWVQFGTGLCCDLTACAALAHAHGALFVADVIQGLGALPLETEAWGWTSPSPARISG